MEQVGEVVLGQARLGLHVDVGHAIGAHHATDVAAVLGQVAAPPRPVRFEAQGLLKEGHGVALGAAQPHDLGQYGEVVGDVGGVLGALAGELDRLTLELGGQRGHRPVAEVMAGIGDEAKVWRRGEDTLVQVRQDEVEDPAELPREVLLERGAADQQGGQVGARQGEGRARHLGRVGRGTVGEAVRRQADGQQSAAAGQVVDQRQRLAQALRVGGEAHDTDGGAGVGRDGGGQRVLAADDLHGAGAAEQVDDRAGRRLAFELGDAVGDVYVVVVGNAQHEPLGNGREGAAGDEPLQPGKGGNGQQQRHQHDERRAVAQAACQGASSRA